MPNFQAIIFRITRFFCLDGFCTVLFYDYADHRYRRTGTLASAERADRVHELISCSSTDTELKIRFPRILQANLYLRAEGWIFCLHVYTLPPSVKKLAEFRGNRRVLPAQVPSPPRERFFFLCSSAIGPIR